MPTVRSALAQPPVVLGHVLFVTGSLRAARQGTRAALGLRTRSPQGRQLHLVKQCRHARVLAQHGVAAAAAQSLCQFAQGLAIGLGERIARQPLAQFAQPPGNACPLAAAPAWRTIPVTGTSNTVAPLTATTGSTATLTPTAARHRPATLLLPAL